MIEDTSVEVGKTASWNDLTSAAAEGLMMRHAAAPRSQADPSHALIVYQNADLSQGESEATQLLAKARVVLPAVMNYLYFNSAKVAVVYFGKTVVDGCKVGIHSGAEDFKIRMIRFFTSEIWPTLLRTDAPDESLGHDYLRNTSERSAVGSVTGSTGSGPTPVVGASNANAEGPGTAGVRSDSVPICASSVGSPPSASAQVLSKETAQEVSWFRKSIENRMQVLLYLKNGINGTKYLKVILNNNAHRIHFDVADPKEEKYRWELRMLFTRLMDNLETQRAIESYESYEANFRLACATAAANAVELERPLQAMTPVTLWGTTHHSGPVQLGQLTESSDGTHSSSSSSSSSSEDRGDGSLMQEDSFSANGEGQLHEWEHRSDRDAGPQPGSCSEGKAAARSSAPLSHGSWHAGNRSAHLFPPATLPKPTVVLSVRRRFRAARAREEGLTANAAPPCSAASCDPSAVVDNVDHVCGGSGDSGDERRAPSHPLKATGNGDGDDGEGEEGEEGEGETWETHRGDGVLRPVSEAMGSSDAFTAHSRGARLNPSKTRYYRWMENLQRPESATLDYKSYFSHSALEIRHRCVRFMCGFLNAYREGKLVIGVHEIPRRDADGKLENGKGGRNSIVLHNDLIDQFVIGVRISESELEEVQEDVSQQLLSCVPPIPPQTVSIDVIPVVYPEEFTYSQRVLVLYEENSYGPSRDALKQKSNYAIRFLSPLGLSIIPMDLVDSQLEEYIQAHLDSVTEGQLSDKEKECDESENSNSRDGVSQTSSRRLGKRRQKSGALDLYGLKAEAYIMAAISDPFVLTESDWEAQLSEAIGSAKSRCSHFFMEWPTHTAGPLTVPQLHVVEVSVDIQRSNVPALKAYRGKFFTGWPSIPIWDAATRSVRRVERNYNIFGDAPKTCEAVFPATSMQSTTVLGQACGTPLAPHSRSAQSPHLPSSPTIYLNVSTSASGFQRAMMKHNLTWFSNLQIMNNVLSYLYGQRMIQEVLQFRRVHPVWDRVFENRQGTPLVHMIDSTPFGIPMFNNTTEHISRTQYAFLRAGVPPMPLILCRIYEILGNLPSPYPFVTVPLVQQSFRVSSFLLPIFYRQHYFDGTMRISVVLDLRDGILKTMQLRDGNLVLEVIVGVCFEKMNKRQVTRQLERIAAAQEEKLRLEARAHSKNASRLSSPRQSGGVGWKHGSSFLARRTLQPQMLRKSRGQLSSTVLSPMLSENTRLTRREAEPNIPLIHFRFLTRKLLEEGAFVVSNTPSPGSFQPTQQQHEPIFGVPPQPPRKTAHSALLHGASWTLQHLLSWYNALIADAAHLSVFGLCERSIAFQVADFSEICEDDVEPGAVDLASAKDLRFAPCREACTLHRKVMEWMEV